MLVVKVLLLIVLFFIFYQDYKDQLVYWFLFPIIGFLAGYLHFTSTLPELFYISSIMNLIFISILLLIVLLYAKIKMKSDFKSIFGSGDVLLFFCLSFSFSTVSFIIIFISSLIFSLVIHLVLKRKSTFITVPLAGYMSLFFAMTYLTYWFGGINLVYNI